MAGQQDIISPSDLRGLSLLAADGVIETSRIVEQLHHSIARLSLPLGRAPEGRRGGISGLVYRSIRGIASVSGQGAGWALARFAPSLPSTRVRRDAWVSMLNGVMGDYLEARTNPLAIPMRLSLAGQSIDTEAGLTEAQQSLATRRVLISLHGLCLNESCWFGENPRNNLPLGLAASHGFTPVFLRYNSGRHISDNGQELARYLEQLLAIWPLPVDEIVLLGHSMGGLLARSACHYAEQQGLNWLNALSAVVALGSPHQGAPLERIGVQVHRLLNLSPYSAPFGRLGRMRSAGITDLRFGSLCREDWVGQDRFEPGSDSRMTVRLADHVRPYAVAATLDSRIDSLRSETLGDGLVPVASALGHHRDQALCWPVPSQQQYILCRSGHIDLVRQAGVLKQLREWL